MLRGRICGIFGFGGIGTATARLMRCVGMRIHAINRLGATDEKVDWIGTPDRLDELLAAADVLIISTPLTRATQGVIGKRELSLMKEDAILINLARGEITDEEALYEHLTQTPVHGLSRCVVDRARAAWRVPHQQTISAIAERDRLAAQFSVGRRCLRCRPPACAGKLSARFDGRDAAARGQAGRKNALIRAHSGEPDTLLQKPRE